MKPFYQPAAGLCLGITFFLTGSAAANAQDLTVGGIFYDIEDGNAVVIGPDENIPEVINIPATVSYLGKSYPVTEIKENAFIYAGITSLSLGENVVKICASAFEECASLQTVNLGSVQEIGERAFYGCPKLSGISWSRQLRIISSEAFWECRAIGPQVSLPATLTSLETSAFVGCKGIRTFVVDSANENFCSPDGAVYSKDRKSLYVYPAGSETVSFTLPSGTKEIRPQAMRYAVNMRNINLNSDLEKIGALAFANSSLTNLKIPASVTEIGSALLNGCPELGVITVDAANPNYCMIDTWLTDKRNNTALATVARNTGDVTVSEGIERIGGLLFSYDNKLKTIKFPSSLRAVEVGAFYECENLTSVVFSEGIEDISEMAFQECIQLSSPVYPSTLKRIGDMAFADCFSIKEVILPDGLEYLGSSSYFGCYQLGKLFVPGSLSEWGPASFIGCTSLSDVSICEGITAIPDQTFVYCDFLASLELPSSLRGIGESAFGMSGLREIKLPENLEKIDAMAFYFSHLKEITIPAHITSIPEMAFAYCSELEKVRFNGKVREIGSEAFAYMDALNDIILPEGLEKLGDNAISECPALTHIELPSTLTDIGYQAFYACPLTQITANEAEPPVVTDETFSDSDYNPIYSTCKLSVRNESLDAYKEAPVWRNFTSIDGNAQGVETVSADDEVTEVYGIDGSRISPDSRGIRIERTRSGRVVKTMRTK